jgi:hypothetical protein
MTMPRIARGVLRVGLALFGVGALFGSCLMAPLDEGRRMAPGPWRWAYTHGIPWAGLLLLGVFLFRVGSASWATLLVREQVPPPAAPEASVGAELFRSAADAPSPRFRTRVAWRNVGRALLLPTLLVAGALMVAGLVIVSLLESLSRAGA